MTDLATLQPTYSELGATAGPLPDGYHHVRKSAVIGHDASRWKRRLSGIGPVRAPCRVVYVIEEADRRGFAYGTLPGHPESGEEMFAVRYDPASGEVYAEVVAFSRHGTWWSRLAAPITALMQRIITSRYLTAL